LVYAIHGSVPGFFGYGLFVDLWRMREVTGGWRRCDVARLPGHRLVFRVPDPALGLREDVVEEPSAAVHGLLYEVEEGQLDAIGRAEPPYRWDTRSVEAFGARGRAWVLLGRAPTEPGKPSAMYLSRLVWGYGQHPFPPEAKAALLRATSP
jgi:hypothetical protein